MHMSGMKLIACATFFALTLGVHAQSAFELNLQKQILSLQIAVTALQKQLASGKTVDTTLQNQVNLIAKNPVLKLAPYVSVDLSAEDGVTGPNVTFKGVNVHIVDGSGFTDGGISEKYVKASGLGNLIIGYNVAQRTLATGERGACHMLIMGDDNRYTDNSFAGIVTGGSNYVNGYESFVIGGVNNQVNENNSTIIQSVQSVLTGGSCNLLAGGVANSTTNGCDTALFGGLAASGNPAYFSAALGGINGTVIGVNGVTN